MAALQFVELSEATQELWRSNTTVLHGSRVRLEPYDAALHGAKLFEIGGRDESIGRYYPPSVPLVYDSAEHMISFFEARLATGNAQMYVVVDQISGKPIGSYSLLDIQRVNRSVEIAAIWLAQSARGTGVNAECIFLLLQHCIEVCIGVCVGLSLSV
jgi:RimJ/RimL family protein N-acetyltransferase